MSHRLRDTWPLRRADYVVLLCTYAGLVVVWGVFGWLLVHPLAHSRLVHADQSVSRWFAAHRTPWMNHATAVGSFLASTFVKIGVTVVIALAMLWVWRRWLETLMVSLSLLLEASAFITVTVLVGRPRPDVVHLEASNVGTSYPSGHTAAAAVYAAIVVVIFWHTRRRWIRAVSVAVVAVLPIYAGVSRVYRGMHFLSDVIAGAVLGVASVAATAWVLRRADARFGDERSVIERRPHGVHESRPEQNGA